MPNCNFLQERTRCSSYRFLTIFIIYDAVNNIFETVFLCQAHSNLVIGEYMQEYEAEVKVINFLQKRRKEERNLNNIYNVRPEYTMTDQIKQHFNRKNKISNYSCRSLICNNQITKHQNLFSITILHSNGRFRHYFYFCSKKCLDIFKAKIGLIVPILEKQISITNF